MDYDRLRELQEKYDENPRRYFAPLANEYRKGGQVKRAIEICRSQLAQMPGHMSGQIVYGQSLYEAGEFDEARQVFERALTLDPENLIALRSLGDMSLQAGNTTEARSWYARLLDADPKDTTVIALISEIDESVDASPVAMAAEIPGVDLDLGDQEIPAAAEDIPQVQSSAPAESSTTAAVEGDASSGATIAPDGLERHYPVAESSSPEAAAPANSPEGLSGVELGVPVGASAAEGLTSEMPESSNPLDWTPTSSAAPEQEAAPPSEPASMESESHAQPTAAAPESPVHAGEKSFTGASSEPFVNETMAQLYLQQGYKQLALQVYRQLAVSRPQDEGLRQRIEDIEAADAAEHPGEVPASRREPSVESPVPRSPSIESPTPGARESEEGSSFDRPPVDSPPSRQPAPERESIEAPMRAEPGGMAARQPSIREFFATLGRRRPARRGGGGLARPENNQPAESHPPLGTTAPGASLDSVFAGATVSPSDARAASRLAGAFSGATGASRTPPTPPMPTPRVNPRVPQAQESEEDVAKFRAWLDGLTGE